MQIQEIYGQEHGEKGREKQEGEGKSIKKENRTLTDKDNTDMSQTQNSRAVN